MANTTQKYKKLFISEAEDKIAALNAALLALEKHPDDGKFASDAMRAAHTLKSSAAAMDYMQISHLVHAMEDVFMGVSSKKIKLEPQITEILFRSVDTLSSSIALLKLGEPEVDTRDLVEALHNPGAPAATAKVVPGSPDENPQVLAPLTAIKVDVKTLDALMNLTEELLVEKMRLAQVVRAAKERPDELINRSELEASSEIFSRLISELQLQVTEARMVPLMQIFERFPRMVRDLAHEQGKEIDFQTEGGDIELDRTVIDRLAEPLIHLLRNAVDHGIPKTGKIKLGAIRERDKVLIDVINDSSSINWTKIIETAVGKGVIDKAEGDKYLENIEKWKTEVENLLYGLSTKEKVTETSGRGVGLSIVKTAIETLGGKVIIESPTAEGGTTFRLQLPLTLAIIQALLVRVANQVFALPFSQIDRSEKLMQTNIKKAFDQEIAVIGGQDIPMIRLDKLFQLQRENNGDKNLVRSEYMIVTKHEEQASADQKGSLTGLVVDEMVSEQSIVVKPLKGTLRKVHGFAGITLLGDGKPAMILDVATLISTNL